jgi:two-component system sensor histidine kinase YesM
MAAKQQYLIENIYEQNLRVAKTELKFLQSQINPHFLYNTLDSNYWMAKNYDADEISEMVLNLSKFFRLSLDKGRETIAVAETFEHLHYYIRVQQLRFMDKFEVQFTLPDACKKIQILRLLVQPLVENAIIHGLEKKQSGGILQISAKMDETACRIEIFDNGKGISSERLHYIQTKLAIIETADSSNEIRDSELFGLRNVRSRLKLFYTDQANLFIESKENEWTRVTIQIPLKRDLSEMEG